MVAAILDGDETLNPAGRRWIGEEGGKEGGRLIRAALDLFVVKLSAEMMERNQSPDASVNKGEREVRSGWRD
jgi:hypothetical protein